MLQTLHDKFSGTIAKILLGLLTIVFGGFFGIQSYMNPRSETWVAKVGDTEITAEQFREAYNRYRAQMQRQMGPMFDAAAFDTAQRRHDVLDSLVKVALLENANAKLGLVVPPQQIRDLILNDPNFQQDGKFDSTRYRLLLQGAGMTAANYEDSLRKDLATRLLPSQLASAIVVTNADIDAYLRLRDQTRDFSWMKLDKPSADGVKVADADIESYFKAHQADYMTPEKVSLAYVELDSAALAVNATPDDKELKQRYEDQKAKFTEEEQREASHILVKVPANAGPDAQKAALEKAKAIAAEAKSGKDFAALAKEKSEDLGSKSTGGDLGWLAKGVTDPAFEAALFAMNKGDISDPVLSPEGYHIIQLRDIKAGAVKPYEAVKADLAKQYLETERERRYSKLASDLIDAVGREPSLEQAAKALNLPVQKTALFTRAGGIGIAANPKVIKAAFSNTVLSEGGTSDSIELAPNHIVVVHLDQHEAAVPKALDAVRDDIRKKLVDEEVNKRAKEQADTLFARLEKGETLEQLAPVVKGKVEQAKDVGRNAANVDARLIGEVFKVARPQGDKPANAEVTLAGDAYALISVTAVKDADTSKLDAKTREAARNQLVQAHGGDVLEGFVEALRKSTKVELAEDRLQ